MVKLGVYYNRYNGAESYDTIVQTILWSSITTYKLFIITTGTGSQGTVLGVNAIMLEQDLSGQGIAHGYPKGYACWLRTTTLYNNFYICYAFDGEGGAYYIGEPNNWTQI